jgi:hypothetical protein
MGVSRREPLYQTTARPHELYCNEVSSRIIAGLRDERDQLNEAILARMPFHVLSVQFLTNGGATPEASARRAGSNRRVNSVNCSCCSINFCFVTMEAHEMHRASRENGRGLFPPAKIRPSLPIGNQYMVRHSILTLVVAHIEDCNETGRGLTPAASCKLYKVPPGTGEMNQTIYQRPVRVMRREQRMG